jgi:uncharacterized membrane protein (DUF485 family)
MKYLYASIFAVFAISVAALLFCVHRFGLDLYDFYSKKMQTPLFTGFLTLGGFLLSLKTFILIKLKEGLYDHKQYQELVKQKQSLNPKYTHYGPLSRLSHFLVHSVLLALLTSFFQFSVGFVKSNIVAAIGMSLAVTTITVVLLAWWNIRENLNCWFEMLEKEKRETGNQ